jgi:hypothetical protein
LHAVCNMGGAIILVGLLKGAVPMWPQSMHML